MKYIIASLLAMICAATMQAQVTTKLPIDTAKQSGKNGTSLSVGSGGVKITKDKDTADHAFEVQFGMLDLGINSLIDHTDYGSAEARDFLHVASSRQNADLFSLRTSKSINVNIYPIMVKARLFKSAGQKITLASGIGMQLYNFRFTKSVTYEGDEGFHPAIPNWRPGVSESSTSYSKNKLAFNYLTVPLMINAKTRISDSKSGGYWLTYGVGISGGYLLSSWTKQISDERGKEKNHDPFNFRKTNFCVNGEFGLDGYIRLYASYQVTALHEDALDQHPFCIGVRFLGL